MLKIHQCICLGCAIDRHALDLHGSFSWIADPGERIARASTAIALQDGWLLVDPVEAPGLDVALAERPVRGIVLLMARHRRDSEAVAARHGVAGQLVDDGAPLPFAGVQVRRTLRRPGWREALLWLDDRGLLVVGDLYGTLPYFLTGSDVLGMHPALRPLPPRLGLAELRPRAIAVGHGRPVTSGAAEALELAERTAIRGLPRNWWHIVRTRGH